MKKNNVLEEPYKAPKIAGVKADGSELSPSELKGKWVVLYFYPKDMTPGCTTQAGDFEKARRKFAAADAVIVGVSKDSCARLCRQRRA